MTIRVLNGNKRYVLYTGILQSTTVSRGVLEDKTLFRALTNQFSSLLTALT